MLHGGVDHTKSVMMRTIFPFLALTFLLSGVSCKNKEKKELEVIKVAEKSSMAQENGKDLMQTHCYLCHSPSAPLDEGRIGPPMIAIKAHYQKAYGDREAFINGIVEFVERPDQKHAKLKGAVRRFGLMPYQQYDSVEVRTIAAYLYDFEIEEPDWFKAHWQERQDTPYDNKGKRYVDERRQTIADVGLSYALGTKKVLGSNLMGTIQKEGVKAALAFCNAKAYSLTDSMAIKYQAHIKRVSDRARNPDNKANSQELKHINTFKKVVANGDKITPILEQKEDSVAFYYPIVTNNMCLKCHGSPTSDIEPQITSFLSELYPEDQATGYRINEVRGIWSIKFANTAEQ